MSPDGPLAPGQDAVWPQRIGPYLIEAVLGQGGMGEVLLALDERLGRQVAIKRILPQRHADPGLVARFRREAMALARLCHPAIVQVFELLADPEGDCLVMERVPGRSLAEHIAAGDLDLRTRLRLAAEMADGLAEAHAHLLIHRDLKPENVLVTPSLHARIVDFGLARRLGEGPDGRLTQDGVLVGTFHAMSPEQAAGREVDHRSDLFAFGSLLYELFSGEAPFRAGTWLETLSRLHGEQPAPLAELCPELPPELSLLVESLLGKRREDRPPNARLVAQALEQIAAALPGPGFRPPPPAPGVPLNREAALDADGEPTADWEKPAPPVRTPPPRATPTPRPLPGWRPAAGGAIPRRPHWLLVEPLGAGGCGEAWLASHPCGDRRVFKFGFAAEDLRALKREVSLFRVLKEALGQRPDLARILDWQFDQEPFFLESEFAAGGNLAAWAERQGGLATLGETLRLRLALEIAEALAASHSAGVLHKDIKPENVLVEPRGESPPQLKLCDFGIGHCASREWSAPGQEDGFDFTATLGRTNAARGTLGYLAPELLEGRAPSARSDVYSLGVLIYQLVVGDFGRMLAPGWERDVADEVLAEDLALFLDGRPEQRPENAQEVAERLRTLEARRERRGLEKALERARGRRRQLGVAAALGLAVLAVVTLLGLREFRARREAEAAQAEAIFHRKQAEDLVGFLVGDLRQKLEPLGRLDLLGAVSGQALAYFAQLPAEKLTDEDLLRRTRALYQIGEVRAEQGDLPAARVAYQESLKLAEALVARAPDDEDRNYELARVHFWLGHTSLQQGQVEAADAEISRYLALIESGSARRPESEKWRFELGHATNAMAAVLERQGRLEPALAILERSNGIKESLLERKPGDFEIETSLANGLSRKGQLLFRLGRSDASLAAFAAERARRESLFARDRGNADSLSDLAVNQSLIGEIAATRGDWAAAIREYSGSLARFQELVARDPTNQASQGHLLTLHLLLGKSQAAARSYAAARLSLQQAAELAERLVGRDPSNSLWQLRLRQTREAREQLEKTARGKN